MITRLTSLWKRFKRDESGGTYVIGFALWTPLIFLTLVTAIETGFYTARLTMLERGLDMTVRDIRLTTGYTPSHNEIRDSICERAAILNDCSTNLRVEMMVRDIRNWQAVPTVADCTDRSEPVAAVREFTPGVDNQLMVIRACAKIDPIYSMSWLFDAFEEDSAGDYAIIATSAFVQEPR